jgi:uncharacterized protein (TIGR04540 family)
MNEQLQQLQYHPKYIKEMGKEIKKAVDMYHDNDITREELNYFIEHYANNYGHILFSEDYEVQRSIELIIGKRRLKLIYHILGIPLFMYI